MAKLVRIVIQLPMDLKTRLDGLKQQGYTTSGFIRAMLERELRPWGFYAAFSIWTKPRRTAESTKPSRHLTPASTRKPNCSSFSRIRSPAPIAEESMRTATAALVLRNGDISASADSIAWREL